MRWHSYKPGDRVVFRVSKHSRRPGPRARGIWPAPHGDTYRYQVDKFWVVSEVSDNGDVIVRTRRGKTRRLAASDLNLRPATWWERWWRNARFPQFQSSKELHNVEA
jgi:hypothetical protein